MPDSKKSVPPELEDVATQVGEFMEYWGFKSVHGRIWTHLYLSPEPLSASELIKRLDISKALVSMSLNDLLEYDVIQVAGKIEHGTTTYQANPDVISVITNVLRKREKRMLGRVASAAKALKALQANSRDVALKPERVSLLVDMIGTSETTLDGLLQLGSISLTPWKKFSKS